jgi:hypothetical protein
MVNQVSNKQPCKRDCPERTAECKKTCPKWLRYWAVKQEEYKRRAEMGNQRIRPWDP